MDTDDVQRCLQEFARLYPPLITLQQASVIAQCPLKTIYHWSSQGLFDGFKRRRGRRVRLLRDHFVLFLLRNERCIVGKEASDDSVHIGS